MPSSVTRYERGDAPAGAGDRTCGIERGGGRKGALKEEAGVSTGLTEEGGGRGAELT